MLRPTHFACKSILLALALAVSFRAAPSQAYVDLAPTLSKIVSDSKSIAVVEVVNFNRELRTLELKEVKTLKGVKMPALTTQQVAPTPTTTIPRAIQQWAEPGAQGVLFAGARTALVCIGQAWYQVRLSPEIAKLDVDRPELPLAYYGTVARLVDAIESMLQGRDAVITVMPHGVEQAASFDLALNRAAFPGLVKVQRLRVNLKMPGMVMAVSNSPGYMLGLGPVDERDLPELAARLKSSDAGTRASAADEIRQMTDILGRTRTAFVTPALAALLQDPAPRVRLTSASALLRIDPNNAPALRVLEAGLQDPQKLSQRDAAQAAGVAGEGAAPLVTKLAGLLADTDAATRVAALQALATLGPVAVPAKAAVTPLLDDPNYMIDAADCLGRMGPRAQPIPASMARMLTSDQVAVRTAALRGMSQMGGPEARPAVDFIIQALQKSTEIDAYNMLVFLALLGPEAKPAAGHLRNIPMLNPVLPAAAKWAMDPANGFPWQPGDVWGAPGAGQGPFPGMTMDPVAVAWEAVINELGERLRPAALKLAPEVLSGDSLYIPVWGYRILAAAPDESVKTLSPHLADADLAMRERAALALGFMGPAASHAMNALEAAVQHAAGPQETKLLEWAIRQIQNPS